MGYSVYPAPAAGGKIQKKITLTSGTSWTVPTGVTDINVLLVGGGGGAAGSFTGSYASGTGTGNPGNSVWSTLTVTAGNSINYAIGAGGNGGGAEASGSDGGTTTFTGATSATGGNAGKFAAAGAAASASMANNGGQSSNSGGNAGRAGGAGGSGFIEIEYWV